MVMTMGKRLVALTSIGVTALLAVGLVGISSFRDVKAVVSTITTQTIPRIEAAHSLGATYRDLRLLLLTHITETDPFLKEAFAEKIHQHEKYGSDLLENYELLSENRQDQKDLIAAYKQYIAIYQQALKYSEQNKIDLAQAALYGDALPATKRMEELLLKSAERNKQDEKEAAQHIEEVYQHAVLSFIVGILGTGTIFVILGGLLLRERSISEQFEHRTKTDVLTGLGNRLLFEEQGLASIETAKHTNGGIGLLYMDLNGFKFINDTYGHDVGDEVLKEVATRLKQTLRKADVTVRLGGDEFAVLIQPGTQHNSGIVAQKIVDALNKPMIIKGNTLHAFASIGISIYPDHAQDLDALIKKSDIAMYIAKKEAKKAGHGFACLWNSTMGPEKQQ